MTDNVKQRATPKKKAKKTRISSRVAEGYRGTSTLYKTKGRVKNEIAPKRWEKMFTEICQIKRTPGISEVPVSLCR